MAKNPSKAQTPKTFIYQLHVALDEVEPLVWRRIWIPSDLSLVKLDRVIQTVMGWSNSHLHEFQIAGIRYGRVNPEWSDDETLVDERRLTIGALIGKDSTEFGYLYDFGDNWQHIVTVEQCLKIDESNDWVQCIDGENACPPEDVGGTGGYEDFREAILDTEHEEHVAMRRWSGGPFNPRGFDVNSTNRELRRLGL